MSKLVPYKCRCSDCRARRRGDVIFYDIDHPDYNNPTDGIQCPSTGRLQNIVRCAEIHWVRECEKDPQELGRISGGKGNQDKTYDVACVMPISKAQLEEEDYPRPATSVKEVVTCAECRRIIGTLDISPHAPAEFRAEPQTVEE